MICSICYYGKCESCVNNDTKCIGNCGLCQESFCTDCCDYNKCSECDILMCENCTVICCETFCLGCAKQNAGCNMCYKNTVCDTCNYYCNSCDKEMCLDCYGNSTICNNCLWELFGESKSNDLHRKLPYEIVCMIGEFVKRTR